MVGTWNYPGGFNDTAEVSRAIALIDVLRQVDDSTPIDLILIYLAETDVSGLGRALFDPWRVKLEKGTTNADAQDIKYDNMQHKNDLTVPDGVKSMARSYMIRCYWDQINYLLEILDYGQKVFPEDKSLNGLSGDKVYPGYARNALDAFDVSGLSELTVSSGASVRALAAKIFEENLTTPGKTEPWRVRYLSRLDDDVLTLEQCRKLTALKWAINRFRWDSRDVVPKTIRDAFFDGLLLLFAFFGPTGFRRTVNAKLVHEYAKFGEETMVSSPDARFMRDSMRERTNSSRNGAIDGYVSSEITSYRLLSPNAVICVNRFATLGAGVYCDGYASRPDDKAIWWNTPIHVWLRKFTNRTNTSVKLFVDREIVFNERIFAYLTKDKNRKTSCHQGECECVAPCCCGFHPTSLEGFMPKLLGTAHPLFG